MRFDVVLALLVSTCRAMRRPFYRGTSSRTGSTLFIYINPEQLKIYKRILWEPLCKDFTRMRRNLKRKWLLLLLVVTGVFGLTACSDDYEPWELLETEVTSTIPQSYSEKVSWNGGTFTINVKTNGAWNIEVPEWLSVDKSEGNGDATIEATVERAWRAGERTGEIKLNTAGSESSNVVGTQSDKINFTQEGLENALKITDCSTDLTKESIFDNDRGYYYTQYGYSIKYTIDNPLTEDEINNTIRNAYIRIYKSTRYLKNDCTTIYLKKADLTPGTHVLKDDKWYNEYRTEYNYLQINKVEIIIFTAYGEKHLY